MTQTPEPTPDDDPRSFWSSPISLETLKPALYEAGGGVAPEDLDPAYLTEITDAAAEEAWRFIRDAREGMRADIAALLRMVAAGRREYKHGVSDDASPRARPMTFNEHLEIEASLFDTAAKLAEGDDDPLYGLLPSWRWSEAMTAALYAKPENGRG